MKLTRAWWASLVSSMVWPVLFFAAGCGESDREQPQLQAVVRETAFVSAPSVQWKDLDGNTHALEIYKNKVLIVDFWATWCGPCKVSIPDLNDLYDTYKDQGLVVIGVATSCGTVEAIKAFVEEQRMRYPVVLGNRKIEEAFGEVMSPPRDRVASLPTTFVIDRGGRVIKTYIGYRVNVSQQELEADIKQLL